MLYLISTTNARRQAGSTGPLPGYLSLGRRHSTSCFQRAYGRCVSSTGDCWQPKTGSLQAHPKPAGWPVRSLNPRLIWNPESTPIGNFNGFRDDNRTGLNGTLHRVSKLPGVNNTTGGISIRIARHVKGAADDLLPYILHRRSILLIGPPASARPPSCVKSCATSPSVTAPASSSSTRPPKSPAPASSATGPPCPPGGSS